ncbi:NFX1-type zinc finger-containing protein 1 isoform X2 [Hetaerina americana]|uniref:NFX1-type zinc finger-containing protein 1 isoform X2 n=1 Tax=Hetaerina americana TaxID=62018 RepID=UPI003A7F1FD6
MNLESLSEKLYADIEGGKSVPKVMLEREVPVNDERENPKIWRNFGERGKNVRGNGRMGNLGQARNAFLPSRPYSSQNRRGRGGSRPGRGMGTSEHRANHVSGRKWNGPAQQNSSSQELMMKSSEQVTSNASVFESMLSKKRTQQESEDVPGFRFTQMKELLKKDSSELLMHLTAKKSDLSCLLQKNLRPDMIMLVAEMFAKVSSSDMKENQSALLAQLVQPSVLDQFSSHALNIVAQNMKYSHEEIIKYFENIYVLYHDVVDILPYKASEVLKYHPTNAVMALQNLKTIRKVQVPLKLEDDYKTLMAYVESLLELHKSALPKKPREKIKREWQPGIDFRQLSIHPLPEDLLRKGNVDICPAIIEGPYKSVEHYLDVQFNLMREDFLIPLREGIANFVEQRSSKSNKRKQIENVRFYTNVRFLNQFIEGDIIVTEVLFNCRAKKSRHNWKRSKRFLYGSLVCFTSDMFSSVLLGIIVDRSVELLEKGILRCELIGNIRDDNLFKREYIMAENEIYFEAYQHVMRALQSFNENNFPLREYLIDVSSDLHLPSYLANNPGANYTFDRFTFPVIEEYMWPPREELKVNESQFKALHSALTKKCAVIQGPPGTGKTYLGLIIAKLLLKNSNRWRGGLHDNGKGPMLVVCFTNHALDQFLEGMLSFTENIIRVGSQSKNEKLNEYNLRVVRKKKGMRALALYGIEGELEQCARAMNHSNGLLKECLRNVGILSLEYLCRWMAPNHASWFVVDGILNDNMLVEWLLSGAYFLNMMNTDVSMDDTEPIPGNMVDVYAENLENLRNYVIQLNDEALRAEGYELETIQNMVMMYVSRFQYLKNKLTEKYEQNEELPAELAIVKNLNDLHPELRWVLYQHWCSKAVEHYQETLMQERRNYKVIHRQKSEILEDMYLGTILDCDVVGMTTTGAAKHQALLQKLGSKIVIVEEAAEAMESHIVVSLSAKCEHLILIGDHKQLRPSTAVYKLAKDFNMEISLFERLLMNGVRFDTLRIQHRMRPDIADLVYPAVYPVLENHPSVLAYEDILGLKKNLYFITHTYREDTAMDDLSKKNQHEAEFLIALCRHIILQGYDPCQITILTTYLGQLFLLTEERERHSLIKNVRIAVVDNFQGEENDIILLSLVRNNEEGNVGFLASENRICVALSRAKKGLYIMGNIDMLSKKSHLWAEIRNVLQKKEAVGTHLTLQCLKHPEQLTEVSQAQDFDNISEGGCRLMCGEQLNCGHMCKKLCHVQGHSDFRCHETCGKVMCIRDHRCQKLCWQNCGDCMVPVESNLPCGHKATLPCHMDPKEYKCPVEVSVKLPNCEHENKKLCCLGVDKVNCSFPCDSRLPCGHVCPKKCHVYVDPEHLDFKCLRPCSRKNVECKEEHICQRKCHEECSVCMYKVKRKLPNCDHYHDMYCHQDPLIINCHKPCKKKLKCGHDCPKRCLDECGGCQKIVQKEIPDCKHVMTMKCCEVPARHMCKEKCTRMRSCGHPCTAVCGIPCSEKKCESMSSRTSAAACGHLVRLFCDEVSVVPSPKILMKRCKEACGKILECSHRCKGTCGQCMQGRIHIPCQEKCGRNLICGHECTVSCSQTCPPCKKKCFVICEHSKCKNMCGKPCAPCREQCGWQCEHKKCKKKCSELCDRLPCNEPCKKKLKCGHDCIGFCGEKCPELCRVCNPEEVDEILTFLGTDDDENARFVILPDCGHTFESTGLEKWLSMGQKMVKMLECPMCKTPIQQAYRYGNEAKIHFSNVLKVKYKIFGNLKQINNGVIKSALKLKSLTSSEEYIQSKKCLDDLQCLVKRSRRESFGAFVLNSLEARTEFVLSVVEHYNELKEKVNPNSKLDCRKVANVLIKTILCRLDAISVQEHSDIKGECMRFYLLMKLGALENVNGFTSGSQPYWYRVYEECRLVVEGMAPFKMEMYPEMNKKLNDAYNSITNGNIGLSKHEMKEVVKAINLHQGHWIRCPNGHVFVIADCGGAVSLGRCNECRERIGGADHQLLSTNRRLQNVPEGL